MRLLLTGKNGQLGFELQRSLAPLGRITAVDSADCDLSKPDDIRRLIRTASPDIIINPAAYTAVDQAESQPDIALAVNAQAPAVLGHEAAKLGIPVVHFSTDYVFDGTKTTPYREDDPTAPLGAYGRSKRDGETALQSATPRHLILRTSWVFGAHGQNFAKTMLRLAQERTELRVVADQIGAPTSAPLLADLTAHLVRQMQTKGTKDFPFGLYHVSATGATNWCEYARHVLNAAIIKGYRLNVGPGQVIPIASEEYPTLARRPKNSQLDTSKFTSTFGLTLPEWQLGLNHILQQIL
jgi:dTDP-4-dehydrorhamnose reductase